MSSAILVMVWTQLLAFSTYVFESGCTNEILWSILIHKNIPNQKSVIISKSEKFFRPHTMKFFWFISFVVTTYKLEAKKFVNLMFILFHKKVLPLICIDFGKLDFRYPNPEPSLAQCVFCQLLITTEIISCFFL